MPDSDEISMRVDVEMDGKRILRQSFVLRRESNVQLSEQPGLGRREERDLSPVPPGQ